MAYYLFLDDIRVPRDVKWVELPPRVWTIVRDYKAFVKVIDEKGIPDIVTYDHDLALEHYTEIDFQKMLKLDYKNFTEKTGYDCAKYLVSVCEAKCVKHPEYYVHSMNPIGKENIEGYIQSYHKSLQ